MLACEARHPSWFGAAATALLQQHTVTRVIADPAAGQPGPHVPTTAASYRRLHGAPRIYYSSYDDAFLAALADAVAGQTPSDNAWIIFDNTASGAAIDNALTLQQNAASP
jgi:uncharacterized protein YecE (DUF72 family)